jgi:hypothetical protein
MVIYVFRLSHESINNYTSSNFILIYLFINLNLIIGTLTVNIL